MRFNWYYFLMILLSTIYKLTVVKRRQKLKTSGNFVEMKCGAGEADHGVIVRLLSARRRGMMCVEELVFKPPCCSFQK